MVHFTGRALFFSEINVWNNARKHTQNITLITWECSVQFHQPLKICSLPHMTKKKGRQLRLRAWELSEMWHISFKISLNHFMFINWLNKCSSSTAPSSTCTSLCLDTGGSVCFWLNGQTVLLSPSSQATGVSEQSKVKFYWSLTSFHYSPSAKGTEWLH